MIINAETTKAILDTEEGCFIKWRLTDWCNYRCSYCIRKAFTKRTQHLQDKDLASSWEKILKTAPEVNRIMEEFGRPTKIDLIGGEITFMDLPSLIDILDSKFLTKINITTNLSNKQEFYEQLIEKCKSRGIILSLTASYHYEFADLGTFITKASHISKLLELFKVEMVSAKENQPIVRSLIEKCKAENIKFIIEKDFTLSPEENQDLLGGSLSENSNDRYRFIDSEGKETFFKTRNLLVAEGLPFTRGFRCTRDWNYVYIELDDFMGHKIDEPEKGCKTKYKVKDFHPLEKPAICLNPRCTLCGRMSLIKDELLDDYLKGEGLFKKN